MSNTRNAVVIGGSGGGGGGGLSYTVNSGTTYPANVTSITLPDGVTSIETYAFYGRTSLASITLPSGVTSIGFYAFSGCASLASITLPSGVTSIGAGAFYGCSSLASITLPSGVTSIGTSAFYGCSALMKLTVLASTPPTLGTSALSNVPATCSIRVPAGSVAAYQAAPNWSDRAAYITAI